MREVLELAHLRNEDIGLALGISPETVKSLLRSAYVRLGVENRTGAVMAMREAA